MNHVRPWLPALLALSVNSPYWLGADTGYASYRTEVWNRWPTAGLPELFASRADYDALVEALTATAVEAGKLYWDVRPSTKQPTLEFRVADVCMEADEAVMVAGLARALAFTAHEAARPAEPIPAPARASGRPSGRPPAPASTATWWTWPAPAPCPRPSWSRCSWPRSAPGWRRPATSRR